LGCVSGRGRGARECSLPETVLLFILAVGIGGRFTGDAGDWEARGEEGASCCAGTPRDSTVGTLIC